MRSESAGSAAHGDEPMRHCAAGCVRGERLAGALNVGVIFSRTPVVLMEST
jgi:hypothetical protein